MARSIKKGPYVHPKLARKIAERQATKSGKPIKTWSRDSMITPDMVGLTIEVHNGKDFIPVHIHEDLVGHKLGEFAPTRKFSRHGGKLQRELERQRPGR